MLLFVRTPLHPPLALAVASHAANCVFTAACVWQEATVVFTGQVKTAADGAVTVNVAEQVATGAQLLV